MIRWVVLAALLAVASCARQSPAPTAPATATKPAAPPAAQTGPSQSNAPPAPPTPSPRTETEQATSSQESSGGDTDAPARSDASLEKIAGMPPATQLPAGEWQPGVNYDPVVPAQPTNVAPGKVEVMEMFWLACPHCYDLEPFIQGWLKTKPAYIEFVRVPVMWQDIQRAHARLYYTLESLGRPGLSQKAFETLHQLELSGQPPLFGRSEDETFKMQQSFAVKNGVSADDFAKAFNSFAVNSQLQRAEELTQRYRVETVPFIVINGKYTTGVTKAGSGKEDEAKLIQLINDLAAAEHRH
jgi:protein dithiol oxidoreductase (disulfide-forming)